MGYAFLSLTSRLTFDELYLSQRSILQHDIYVIKSIFLRLRLRRQLLA